MSNAKAVKPEPTYRMAWPSGARTAQTPAARWPKDGEPSVARFVGQIGVLAAGSLSCRRYWAFLGPMAPITSSPPGIFWSAPLLLLGVVIGLLVGLAMDAPAMTSWYFTGHHRSHGLGAGAGSRPALIGSCHFLAADGNVQLFAAGRSLPLALAVSSPLRAHRRPARRHRRWLRCIARLLAATRILAARTAVVQVGARHDRIVPATKTLFSVEPIPITEPVVVTWGLMAALARVLVVFWPPGRGGHAVSVSGRARADLVGTIEDRFTARCGWRRSAYADGRGRVPVHPGDKLVVIGFPGNAPTAHIETDAALGSIVFFAIVYFGVRARRRRS